MTEGRLGGVPACASDRSNSVIDPLTHGFPSSELAFFIGGCFSTCSSSQSWCGLWEPGTVLGFGGWARARQTALRSGKLTHWRDETSATYEKSNRAWRQMGPWRQVLVPGGGEESQA